MKCLILIGFFPLLACGQSITVDASKTIDYTRFETFTVAKGEFTTPGSERLITEEQLYELIREAVIRELVARGYIHVEDSTAQLIVSYVAGAYNVTEGGKLGPFGEAPITNPAMIDQNRYWSEEHRAGILILEMTQPKSNTPVWSAEARLNLSGVEPQAIDSIVAKMLKKFPNRLKKKKKK
jgi:hypothetical protein